MGRFNRRWRRFPRGGTAPVGGGGEGLQKRNAIDFILLRDGVSNILLGH